MEGRPLLFSICISKKRLRLGQDPQPHAWANSLNSLLGPAQGKCGCNIAYAYGHGRRDSGLCHVKLCDLGSLLILPE